MWKDSIKELLIEEAHEADRVRSSRHAACIVHRGTVLSVGRNRLKSHPMMKRFSLTEKKIYLHAEVDAIIKAAREFGTEVLKKSDLFVLRLNKTDQVSSSKPCPTCAKAISAFGLTPYWTENL